ncbi:hypothetical protein E2C01_097952 [Portunus trituberculatus]|uniref:Uncharacterized protein n=1 Tax=Portunus trituberculatus TaxID=210409 RepID=A0A5B7K6Z6_PORTR|nr:hypothetical protein [Portunus trituberculatus]
MELMSRIRSILKDSLSQWRRDTKVLITSAAEPRGAEPSRVAVKQGKLKYLR